MFFSSLVKAMQALVKAIFDLVATIKSLQKLIRLRTPGLVFLKVIEENGNMLKFVLVLPAPGAEDVVERELVVKIGDAEAVTFSLDGKSLESEELSCADNTTVTGTLVDIDDATPANRSEARTFEFIVVDTIAPPMPGELGVRVTAEVADPAPAPDPTPIDPAQ